MITLTKTYKPDLSPIADDYVWVFANLTIGADTIVFRTSCQEDMTNEQIQAYLTSKEEDFTCQVYRDMYKLAEIGKTQEETEKQAWERWVAAGCVNPDQTVIGKKPYNDKHSRTLASKNALIKAALVELDVKRVRPLAEGDTAYLEGLNAQAAELRSRLVSETPQG